MIDLPSPHDGTPFDEVSFLVVDVETTGVSAWSGDRITEDVLRSDLLAKPEASLLKWEDREGGSLLGCDAGLRPRKVSCVRSRGRRNAQSRGQGEAGKRHGRNRSPFFV